LQIEILPTIKYYIYKRYSEFEALHESLPKTIKLPKLPGKTLLEVKDPIKLQERADKFDVYIKVSFDAKY